MNIIKINCAEAIIEPFFDGGESYEGHQKYSTLKNYRVNIPKTVNGTVSQGWCAMDILLLNGEGTVTMERDCDLDVSDFDMLTLCSHHSNVAVSAAVTTEKGEQWVFERETAETKEYSGKFIGQHMTKIRIEVALVNPHTHGNLGLVWMGLANEQRLPMTEENDYRFDPRWDGCFREDYEIGPEIGIYFGKDELAAMREKVKIPPFDKMYAATKTFAYSMKDKEPEAIIEEYLINENKLMCRPGHFHRSLIEGLQDVSFVAMMEEDRELIRLAGRILLSVAVTPHWCESFMGNLPGATWHHRSFLEGLACKRCAIALDWIGSSLTWHAKNLVYDAIIQKGLPRVEADMFTMEYIRHCNQGVVFNDDRIFAYVALAKQYPRYAKMLDIAEADFNEMVELYVEEDGGSLEGPGYWNYTIDNVVEAAIVLARYRGKTLQEYVSPRLVKMADYVLAVLCQRPEGYRRMLLNDTYAYDSFGSYTLNFLYEISGNKAIGAMVTEMLEKGGGLETILLIEKNPQVYGEPMPKGLISLNTSGFTTLREETAEGKCVQLHIRSGKAYFSHFHEDKGQLLLFVDDEELLCDRGNCSAVGKKPISHNLFVPESDGLPYSQLANDCDGRVLEARYEDGVFTYNTDLTGAWEQGIFESITRRVDSNRAEEYLVTDRAVCIKEMPMSLRFHSVHPITKEQDAFVITAPKARLVITPRNYTVERYEIKEDGRNVIGEPVNQLVLHLPTAKEYEISTKLEIKI